MTSETELRPPPLPKGPDEAYCSSCGNLIKLKDEICPNGESYVLSITEGVAGRWQ